MGFLTDDLTHLSDQAIFKTYGTELQNTQGYSLVGHGRAYVSLGLVRFKAGLDTNAACRLLADWGGTKSTSALDLRRTLVDYRNALVGRDEAARQAAKAAGVIAVGLSITGFQKLNLPSQGLDDDFGKGFRTVMQGTIPPAAANMPAFDAVVIVASDDNVVQLPSLVNDVNVSFAPFAAIQWESGSKLNGNVDHFGFAEDIGQPVIFSGPEQRNLNWRSDWDPAASPNLVLNQVGTYEQEFGSYMAYLKIEQHVDAFNTLVAETSKATGKPESEVAAWILGREKTGQPLQPPGATRDDFRYADPSPCPFAAHIRKVNGRDKVFNLSVNRVVRRGVFYQQNGSKGALFQCFQSKLSYGFLKLWGWALDPNFIRQEIGQDPFLGERDWPPTPSNVPVPPGQASIRRLTTVQHGEFFYFPSKPFFLRLGINP